MQTFVMPLRRLRICFNLSLLWGIGLWDFDSLDDYFGELLHMLAVSGDLILVAVFK